MTCVSRILVPASAGGSSNQVVGFQDETMLKSSAQGHDFGTTSLESLLSAFLLGLVGLSVWVLVHQTVATAGSRFWGVTIDRLSAVLTLLVATVGAVVFRFSQRYLDGEPGRRRFLFWLFFTVVAAYVLMASTNLLLLFAGWSLTSVGLHRLLTFYTKRAEARLPARKKFLISRLGDVALASGIVLIWWTWSTVDLNMVRERAAEPAGGLAASVIGLLVVVAALTKSAQFPFHSWLPETMETPTPVSALMHAGIINAGGVLVVRFAPLIARVPAALFLLSLVGSITMALGLLAMWSQVNVKRALAWSTVAQMGFMMVQCGLAVFPAVVLHIVGHGCYKAWSFLRSGDVPAREIAPATAPSFRGRLGAIAVGAMLAIPALALASAITGYTPLRSPGEAALAAILALSMGLLWGAVLGLPARGGARRSRAMRVLALVPLNVIVALAALALYRGAEVYLGPVLGEIPVPTGPPAWASAILPVTTLAALIVVHAGLPAMGFTPRGRAFFVHALHGFYIGAVADRIVDFIWKRLVVGGRGHA